MFNGSTINVVIVWGSLNFISQTKPLKVDGRNMSKFPALDSGPVKLTCQMQFISNIEVTERGAPDSSVFSLQLE